MAISDLEVFKRRVGYRHKAAEDTFTGNDSTSSFNLGRDNVFELAVLVVVTTSVVDGVAGCDTYAERRWISPILWHWLRSWPGGP